MPRTRYELERGTRCCTRCFRNRYIRDRIRSEGTRGNCDWCGAVGVQTIRISELTDDFRQAVREFAVERGDGDRLDTLFADHFGVFSDVLLEGDGSKREELLLAILEHGLHPKDDVDEPDFRSLFVARSSSGADLSGRWDEKLEALLRDPPQPHGPPESEDDIDLIREAIHDAGLQRTIAKPYFRARIQKDRTSSRLIPVHEMGAPRPDQVKKGGRANRAGKAVLYLASDAETALAEVRAWKGAVVAVAEIELVRPVILLDTVKVAALTTPFGENFSWWQDVRVLLDRLGLELSRPVGPDEEEHEYRPSQHVCELAEAAHFDGVRYPSAMGGGHNLVLFDPSLGRPTTVQYFRIGKPTIRKSPYPYPEMRWEEW